ncbi:hypothetical protein PSAB_04410 [Paenibacillus sabinae T27]|uniref:Uncharacterized protein n=1 Tax=Paenibacillus sabinae T27 TaxID=1268072 RepID=X4ZU28_9BACL|nr:hypothetical protein PSAB_04410 [Paenibacillus sabinae T27]
MLEWESGTEFLPFIFPWSTYAKHKLEFLPLNQAIFPKLNKNRQISWSFSRSWSGLGSNCDNKRELFPFD